MKVFPNSIDGSNYKGISFIKNRVSRVVIGQPLIHQVVLLLLLLIGSSGFAYLVAATGFSGGSLILASVIAVPVLYGILVHPQFGIILLVILAYMLLWTSGLIGVDFPVGTLMDGFEVLLIFGLLLKLKFNSNWAIYKNPVSIWVGIWVAYNLLEFFNPSTDSREAWMYTVRALALVMLMYYVFLYHLDSVQFIRIIFKIWLGLSVFAAAYGLKQQFLGFSPAEEAWHADPRVRALLYIYGHWRVTSIFPDPVSFSYNMGAATIFCISILFGPFSAWKKVVSASLGVLFFWATLYSGTRSANILVPAAIFLLVILKANRTVLMYGSVAAIVFFILINIPTSNYTFRRFQTTFKPSNDASFNVRAATQRQIQPYIRKHPLGAGLGITGAPGVRFHSHSEVAGIPPDSGYVRTALEQGWIGLLIQCSMFFAVLKTAIDNFYRIQDLELKAYCLGFALIIFALAIGNYPQEAFIQFPLTVYLPMFFALIVRFPSLDVKTRNSRNSFHGGIN